MAMKGVNSKSPTIRRILKEAQELATTPSSDFHAAPTESDLFSWHFTIRGPPTSVYSSGIYHGRIDLPPTYPLRPPSFRFMTPTGRFEVNREICLSISGHHEETWMPAWGVRTAMLALRTYMEQPSEGQVGGMDMDDESRRKLANQSVNYKCEECGKTNEEILKESAEEAEKQEQAGGKKLEEAVPEKLRLRYREDIEKQPQAGGSGDGTLEAARKARADAAAARAAATATPTRPHHNRNRSATILPKVESEDAETCAVAARATLAQVGISPASVSGTSTPRAPTRSDSEDIRIAAMFPHARPSPIPRAHQSPNQLEPMVGSPPPPVYRRPMAAPGQSAPAPTGGNSRTSFHEDAFPPYLDSPQPRHPSHSPLSLNEFQGYQPPTTQPPPQPQPGDVDPYTLNSQHAGNDGLTPDLIRAQADAAARYFESLGATGVQPRPNGRPRMEVDPDRYARLRGFEEGLRVRHLDGQQVAGGQVGAPMQAAQGQALQVQPRADVVWIDRLIALLVTALLVLVVKYVGICLG